MKVAVFLYHNGTGSLFYVKDDYWVEINPYYIGDDRIDEDRLSAPLKDSMEYL